MLVWFLFGFMCAMAAVLVVAYFKFVSLRKAVKRAWLRLDINLKNRRELIPSVALSAASFSELERPFVYSLGEMKEKCASCDTVAKRIDCEAEVSKSLQKVFASAAAHEELKKDEHFMRLQRSVLAAESKIQSCKKRYNSAVRDFNTLAEVIPLNLVANMLEFDKFEYFDFDNSLEKILK